jgi:hypothetical protein
MLALFYFSVVKLFHFAAIKANHVIVVMPLVQLINGFAAFKMIAVEQAGLLKLHENAVHRGEPNVCIVMQQLLENVFGCHVALQSLLKDFQNLLPGDGGLESSAFEFVHVYSEAMK